VQASQTQLLARLRSRQWVHWALVLVVAVALLIVYYEHRYSLPQSLNNSWAWFWDTFLFELQHDCLGLLLLFPLIYAAVMLGWRQGLIVTGVALAAIAPYVLGLSNRWLTTITSFMVIGVPPAIVAGIEIKLISDARERRRIEEKRRERAEILRQVWRGQEAERKRIAQELHDGVAQTLLVTATLAHNLLESEAAGDLALKTDLETVKDNSLALVAEVRAICGGLRPSVLDNLGLVSAIKWLADNMRQETGADVALELTGEPYELGADESLAVFRVVQEALKNVAKHAAASSVHVSLDYDHAALAVEIADNGEGFEVIDNMSRFALTGRLGLLGMSERMQAVGGLFVVDSAEGRGTTLRITVGRKAAAGLATLDGEVAERMPHSSR
jgi:two-component system, NarL family, sensor histidine kinase DegS